MEGRSTSRGLIGTIRPWGDSTKGAMMWQPMSAALMQPVDERTAVLVIIVLRIQSCLQKYMAALFCKEPYKYIYLYIYMSKEGLLLTPAPKIDPIIAV